jgi:hypothetical protein
MKAIIYGFNSHCIGIESSILHADVTILNLYISHKISLNYIEKKIEELERN